MNADNPVDVNADGSVTPYDILAVINTLNDLHYASAQGETPANGPVLYPDTNGDSEITPADILNVIDSLAQGEDIPVVSLTASLSSINEGGTTVLTLARTGDATAPLTVPITSTGAADLEDVTLSPADGITLMEVGETLQGTVTFPAGVSELSVSVTAIEDEMTEAGGEEFLLSLGASADFTPDSGLSTVQVSIADTSTGPTSPSTESEVLRGLFGDSLDGFSGGTLSLDLTESGVDVLVELNDDGEIVVTASDGTQTTIGEEILGAIPTTVKLTISGNNNSVTVAGLVIENDLFVTLTGQGNEFILDGTRIGDDFIAKGGSSNDVFVLRNYTVVEDQARFDMGAGDDLVVLDTTFVGGHLIADLGSGNDDLDVFFSTVNKNVNVDAGSGNDLLDMVRANVYNDLIFDGGNGNDRVSAVRSFVSDDAIIKLGSGNDEVFAFGSTVRDQTKIDGESGVDTIFANEADFITDDLDADRVERALAAADPGTGIVSA